MNLTDADVEDILALLDSLPYDELDLRTARFRLTLRRTPGGWTQSWSDPPGVPGVAAPAGVPGVRGAPAPSTTGASGTRAPAEDTGAGAEGAGAAESAGRRGLVAVRAPLPGTFYRAPRPGAAPFVEVGSQVTTDTVVGIVETMKLMNSVHAGVRGTVEEICVGNAEFADRGATLLRIRADP